MVSRRVFSSSFLAMAASLAISGCGSKSSGHERDGAGSQRNLQDSTAIPQTRDAASEGFAGGFFGCDESGRNCGLRKEILSLDGRDNLIEGERYHAVFEVSYIFNCEPLKQASYVVVSAGDAASSMKLQYSHEDKFLVEGYGPLKLQDQDPAHTASHVAYPSCNLFMKYEVRPSEFAIKKWIADSEKFEREVDLELGVASQKNRLLSLMEAFVASPSEATRKPIEQLRDDYESLGQTELADMARLILSQAPRADVEARLEASRKRMKDLKLAGSVLVGKLEFSRGRAPDASGALIAGALEDLRASTAKLPE